MEHYEPEFTVRKNYKGNYSVYLPHQCDEWQIVGDEYDGEPDKESAISQMELFIKKANEALEKLQSLN